MTRITKLIVSNFDDMPNFVPMKNHKVIREHKPRRAPKYVEIDSVIRVDEVCPMNGKKWFVSKSVAEGRARYLTKHSKGHMYAYKCPHCDGWHLTSMKQPESNVCCIIGKGV